MRLVQVDWWDAIGDTHLEMGEHLEPILVSTVGYTYELTETYITITAEICGDEGTLRDVTTIPTCCIHEVTELAARYKDDPNLGEMAATG